MGIGLFLIITIKNPKYDLTGVDIIKQSKNKNKKIKFIQKEILSYYPKNLNSLFLSL